jgi:DNA mismatch repair protein MutS
LPRHFFIGRHSPTRFGFLLQSWQSWPGQISRAGEKATGLEQEIFKALCGEVLAEADAISRAAEALAELDVALALAELACDMDWVRPEIYDDHRFFVEGGRHPVVETSLSGQGESAFIANDCHIHADDKQSDTGRLLLLTGPNMAGKSTYLRQNALIAVLGSKRVLCASRESRNRNR